ncbi:glycosyltransferase family 87 protein [Singulisphaera acidiphila]|uniref:Uncharacterized protein n=1 Tax=Singulisphaera acidiphila (strain ATCC BAA-1392 / DSM 18658 / VKM B-2454 / MOB10) TaxID=886293 RepID=L0DFE3_SINAD|nr:glycosyltransferase family 87 protein [Singulisphaera acidiphila]AGA27580.1 Protein of unknown function (DUF2029) [Singulisphaera acidiphila DSM 18658]
MSITTSLPPPSPGSDIVGTSRGRWRYLRWLVILGSLMSLAAFVQSMTDLREFAGVDLRCKVVGARAIRAKLDPYTFDWFAHPTPELLDPLRPHPGPSRATYTPSLLLCYALPSGLPYPAQRWFWGLLEWAALACSIALLLGTIPGQAARRAFLGIALIFFVASDFWRFHVERGQFYVFVLLGLAAGLRSLTRRRGDTWSAGLAFGLAVALRPNFLLMALPLTLLGYRKCATGLIVTAALTAAATLPVVGRAGWISYAHNVQVWDELFDHGPSLLIERYGPPREVPRDAEGRDLSRYWDIDTGGSTLRNFKPLLDSWAWTMKIKAHVRLDRFGLALWLTAIGALALALRMRGILVGSRGTAALALITALGSEFFLPLRFSYADILLLAPLALLLPAMLRWRRLEIPALMLMSGLLVSRLRFFLGGATEMAQFLLLAGGLTLALFGVLTHRLRRSDRTSRAATIAMEPLVLGRTDIGLLEEPSTIARGKPGNDASPLPSEPGSAKVSEVRLNRP